MKQEKSQLLVTVVSGQTDAKFANGKVMYQSANTQSTKMVAHKSSTKDHNKN